MMIIGMLMRNRHWLMVRLLCLLFQSFSMKKILSLLAVILTAHCFAFAAPVTISKHIKLDQFGYFPKSKKVAVVVDPQAGYNAAESFSPGTGVNQYQVRRWSDDAVVLTGTLVAWNGGATHTQSGDKGWWFDFSTVETAGSYYIYDVVNNAGSYRFEISSNVYDEVMKQAMRMFFYQRINFAKTAPYTDAKWADGAAFEGANQDKHARLYTAKTDATKERDLSGGWFDAGDYNKYTTFTFRTLCSLLETYRIQPAVFTDNYNIPESANGIADILDEVKWELDWLKRMQDGTGTGGLFLKVGVDNYNSKSPPSIDDNPRYYVGECTSSTLTGSAVFALAGIVYKGIPSLSAYGTDLVNRAKSAWARAKLTTSNFTSFQTNCDDGTIKSGDADLCWDATSCNALQLGMAIAAAAYLYEATGELEYKTFFENNYTNAQCYSGWYWGPYDNSVQQAMLRYARLPGANSTVSANIINRKSLNKSVLSITDYSNKTDLYRAHMPDNEYGWGSSEFKANGAIHNYDNVTFNVDPTNHDLYKETGESYLHWYHGVNPMGIVMLSNMYAYGAEACANQIYHVWFGQGTPWDYETPSSKGAIPGYLIGGPNKDYAKLWYGLTSITPPYNQPPQKSYRDWNTSWNNTIGQDEASWAINEPAIYNQAAYVGLLARVMASHAGEIVLPLHFKSFTVLPVSAGAQLSWIVDETVNLQHFIIERSFDGRTFSALSQVPVQGNQLVYTFVDKEMKVTATTAYYRIKAIYPTEEVVSTVRKITVKADATFTVSPNPVTTSIWINGSVLQESILLAEIVDATGNVLQKEQWVQAKGQFSKYVLLENLPAGTYWVRIQTPQGVQTQKVVKQ
jgi:endoglucanase